MSLIRNCAIFGAATGFVLGLLMTVLNFFRMTPMTDSGVRIEIGTLCPVYSWGVTNGVNDTTQLIAMTLLGNAVVYGAAFAVVGSVLFVLKKIF